MKPATADTGTAGPVSDHPAPSRFSLPVAVSVLAASHSTRNACTIHRPTICIPTTALDVEAENAARPYSFGFAVRRRPTWFACSYQPDVELESHRVQVVSHGVDADVRIAPEDLVRGGTAHSQGLGDVALGEPAEFQCLVQGTKDLLAQAGGGERSGAASRGSEPLVETHDVRSSLLTQIASSMCLRGVRQDFLRNPLVSRIAPALEERPLRCRRASPSERARPYGEPSDPPRRRRARHVASRARSLTSWRPRAEE